MPTIEIEPRIVPAIDAITENHASTESVLTEFLQKSLQTSRRVVGGVRDRSLHGPLPIIISITGHRDLRDEDLPKIEEEMRKQFSVLRERYRSTSFIITSALADGADRVGARIALEMGMRFIAVLPMPQDLYEIDFGAESLREFRELLARADHSFELPIMQGRSREDISYRGPLRDDQYAQIGAFLVMHSQILIALWDGVHKNLVGGTSQVVQFRLQGVPVPFAPTHSELDAPDSGPVYHIVTPRKSNPNPIGKPFTLHRLYPPGFSSLAEAEQAQRDIYDRMETFNSDALKYSQELKASLRQSKDYMFPELLQNRLPAMLREILEFYSIADVLSQRFQKRTMLAFRIVLGSFFMAAFFFEMYAGPVPVPLVMGLYLFMFVLIFATVKWGERRGYHVKYLDYRALAEGLRVQFFWKLAGIKDSVADYYMRKQKSELDWIRNAVRSTMTETCSDEVEFDPSPDADRERLEQVVQYWVNDQAGYFGRSAHRNHEWYHKAEKWITAMFVGGLILAGVQLVVDDTTMWLLLVVAMMPVGAAMMHNYLQKNAVAEHAKQYDRMSVFYHRAKVHLDRLLAAGAIESARAFIAELGREALTENGDWILTHRERPLEIPKGS